MSFDIEAGSVFANILAAENIVVDQRDDVNTAYFDVKNRVLVVPQWDVSRDLYDMLLLHETAHAIYTPPQEWLDAINKHPEGEREAFQSYLNVIEDARIDRLQQLKYPGARRSYIKGTRELAARDFFGLSKYNGDHSKLLTVDKINIYYKATKYHDDLKMDYSEEDKKWIDRCQNLRTFDEVVKIAEDLFKATKHELPKTNVSKIQISIDGFDGTFELDENGNLKPSDGKGNSGKGQGMSQQVDPNSPLGQKIIEALKGSETLENLKGKIKQTASGKSTFQKMNHVCNGKPFRIPTYDPDKVISKIKTSLHPKTEIFKKFNNQSAKLIGLMASTFERKKRARDFMRVQESKTGMLDVNGLHKIAYSDDVFLTKTIVPECKNHGFVFLLDCSGSMSNIFLPTLQQLFSLVMFCKRINIPFEVYGFTDTVTRFNSGLMNGKLAGGSSYGSTRFKLIEIATHTMKPSDIINNFDNVKDIQLSGTPLSEALVASIPILERFRQKHRVDKLNLITLTDGGCTIHTRWATIVDPKTGAHYKTGKNICGGEDNTSALYKIIRGRTKANIVNYFVVDNLNVVSSNRMVDAAKIEKHDGFIIAKDHAGTDSTYYVSRRTLRVKQIDENATVEERVSLSKNRILTEKFIASIS